MMATVILVIFVAVLFGAMVRALHSPALAVALGVATYGLEQIASIILPFFSIHQSAFNILMALVIVGSFVVSVNSRFVLFNSKGGFDAALLLLAFLAYFIFSLTWSPSAELTWARQQIPYFVVYVAIIPMLVQPPAEMLRALRVLWIILAMGLLGTALSPNLLFSIAAARVVIASGINDMELGANPLAFADTAVLLALTSTLILLQLRTERPSSKIMRTLGLMGGVYGIAMGTALAFVSGRGEAAAGLVSGVVLVVLITSAGSHRLLRRVLVATTIFSGASFVALVQLQDMIVSVAPRFVIGNLLASASVRGDLQMACINAGIASTSSLIFGIGANGCQALIGLYPHNELIQAFAETGIIGLTVLLMCYYFTLRFAFQTLSRAKLVGAQAAVHVSAFAISLTIYALLVANKRGGLTAPNTYMWVALAIVVCDRARASLRPAVNAPL
ncbi:MAG: hypothetical protein ACYC3F_13980 [Gemmatimonadaceae bacterium]